MKKYLFLALMSATLSTAAVAQSESQSQSQGQQQDPKHDREEWDRKVKEELKLTAEQITSYDAISKEFHDKLTALESNSSLDKDAIKQQKMQLKSEKVSRINQILTPEQQTRFKELIDKKKSESDKSNPSGTGTGGGTGSGS